MQYILPHIGTPNWLYSSDGVGPPEWPIMRRELFGCILLAHFNSYLYGDPWQVGYDSATSQPNDGMVTDGNTVITLEHKVITPHQGRRTTVKEITDLYDEYARKGPGYGSGRTMFIQADAPSGPPGAPDGVLIETTALGKHIDGSSPFDQVWFLGLARQDGVLAEFHLEDAYPGTRHMQIIYFNLRYGAAKVTSWVGPRG